MAFFAKHLLFNISHFCILMALGADDFQLFPIQRNLDIMKGQGNGKMWFFSIGFTLTGARYTDCLYTENFVILRLVESRFY